MTNTQQQHSASTSQANITPTNKRGSDEQHSASTPQANNMEHSPSNKRGSDNEGENGSTLKKPRTGDSPKSAVTKEQLPPANAMGDNGSVEAQRKRRSVQQKDSAMGSTTEISGGDVQAGAKKPTTGEAESDVVTPGKTRDGKSEGNIEGDLGNVSGGKTVLDEAIKTESEGNNAKADEAGEGGIKSELPDSDESNQQQSESRKQNSSGEEELQNRSKKRDPSSSAKEQDDDDDKDYDTPPSSPSLTSIQEHPLSSEESKLAVENNNKQEVCTCAMLQCYYGKVCGIHVGT